jgi:neutral ceramidase
MRTRLLSISSLTLLLGCQAETPPNPDGDKPMNQARCTYAAAPLPPATAGIGETIRPAPITAGVGEAPIDLPIGTPMSGYTGRMRLLGGDAPDDRLVPHARAFVPSAGVQSRPLARALYLKAGSDAVVLVKAELCLAYDRLTYDLEAALADVIGVPGGARGRVIVATSHSHAAPGTYHGAFHLTLGLDLFDEGQYQRLLKSLVTAARAAISGAAPARLGAGIWDGWDPRDEIYSDRRDEDDDLPGPDGKPVGKRKDSRLLVLRVEDRSGKPMALLHSFPIHGTIAGQENPLISVEASGHIDLSLEDRLDSPVLVMHLQGPAGDISPRGRFGSEHCDGKKSLCENYARMESIGELAAPRILSLWQKIATSETAALEVVTRAVENGRNAIQVRGDMKYAPYQSGREVDTSKTAIYNPDGSVRSPIAQFNVESGAGLCGGKKPMLPVDGIEGAQGVPYASCADIGKASKFISDLLKVPLPQEGAPSCETTRATLSALRLGQIPVLRRTGDPTMPPSEESREESLVLVTLPGEPVTQIAELVRSRSPLGADKTFVLGYAQGHVGYLLGVENWLLGGYEPSINLFGPLEGEWLAERAAELVALASTPVREDGEAVRSGERGGPAGASRLDRLVYRPGVAINVPRSPSGQAGTVPSSLPASLYRRSRLAPLSSAQPAAELARVSGRATFVFFGGDPEDDAPEVTLERESAPGVFEPVRLSSGRSLGSRGRDILLTYTPDPIDAVPGRARGHLWLAEWQAVGWDRSQGLGGALSMPLGRYRLTAKGRGAGGPYAVSSAPFAVVADGAVRAMASISGMGLSGRASYPVGEGFRLLRTDGASDGDVPVFIEATATVQSRATSATRQAALDPRDGSFKLDLSGLDASMGFSLTVADKAGNRSLPISLP